jgi:hypothetical protein
MSSSFIDDQRRYAVASDSKLAVSSRNRVLDSSGQDAVWQLQSSH